MAFENSFAEALIMFLDISIPLNFYRLCDNVDAIRLTLLLNIAMKAGQHIEKLFEGNYRQPLQAVFKGLCFP